MEEDPPGFKRGSMTKLQFLSHARHRQPGSKRVTVEGEVHCKGQHSEQQASDQARSRDSPQGWRQKDARKQQGAKDERIDPRKRHEGKTAGPGQNVWRALRSSQAVRRIRHRTPKRIGTVSVVSIP